MIQRKGPRQQESGRHKATLTPGSTLVTPTKEWMAEYKLTMKGNTSAIQNQGFQVLSHIKFAGHEVPNHHDLCHDKVSYAGAAGLGGIHHDSMIPGCHEEQHSEAKLKSQMQGLQQLQQDQGF